MCLKAFGLAEVQCFPPPSCVANMVAKTKKNVLKKKNVVMDINSINTAGTNAMTDAKKMLTMTDFSFKKFLREASADTLKEMLHYLQHDKTNALKKCEFLFSFTNEAKNIEKVKEYFDCALQHVSDLIHDEAVEMGSDEKGNFKMPLLIRQFELALAKRDSNESKDTDGDARMQS